MYRLLYLKIDIKQSKFNLLKVDVPDLLPMMDFCCQFVLYLKENKTWLLRGAYKTSWDHFLKLQAILCLSFFFLLFKFRFYIVIWKFKLNHKLPLVESLLSSSNTFAIWKLYMIKSLPVHLSMKQKKIIEHLNTEKKNWIPNPLHYEFKKQQYFKT